MLYKKICRRQEYREKKRKNKECGEWKLDVSTPNWEKAEEAKKYPNYNTQSA